MSPQGAFLEEILAHPDDDTPRLIYADWLQERGSSEGLPSATQRGEFIRLQCELEHESSSERRQLMAWRIHELLSCHEQAWVDAVIADYGGWQFRRGFVERVSMYAHRFLALADMIWRANPVREADLAISGCEIATLAQWPQLARLTGLYLGGNAIDDDALRLLVASPFLAQLRTLDLHDNAIGAAGIVALTESPMLASLQALDLSRNRLDAGAVETLLSWPHLDRLTRLDLSGNSLDESSRRLLSERLGARFLG
jgi:uncharacterized protein (TIGR02996 family)